MTTAVVDFIFPKLPLSGGGQEEKGTTEDEIVGWHHRLHGHEFEQAPGDGKGQGREAQHAEVHGVTKSQT